MIWKFAHLGIRKKYYLIHTTNCPDVTKSIRWKKYEQFDGYMLRTLYIQSLGRYLLKLHFKGKNFQNGVQENQCVKMVKA